MERLSLPMDLAEDILSRVPAKTVARLRSTSKHWEALLKSGSFAKTHSANAPKEKPLIIMLMDFRVYLVSMDLRGMHENNVAPSFKIAAELYLKDPLCNSSSQVDIRNVFHSDGLLLCTTKDNNLVLWNPCSGDTKWIKPRDRYKESDYFSLGYDDKKSSCRQYKILRVDRQDDARPIKNEYEVYDLSSNSWRVLGVATDWFLAAHRRGISVKGITYWVALDITQADQAREFLLSFDFSTERFHSLSLALPHPFPFKNASLSVVGEEQLYLLGTDLKLWDTGYIGLSSFQAWVLSASTVWSKSLEVEGYKRYKFSDGMSFLVDEQTKVVMYLSPNNMLHIVGGNKHIQVDDLVGDSTCMSSCSVLLNYVPSLAQILQGSLPRGNKRKAPST
ncbi:unnamed protein product [Microthlaspi erraticum]|uniref:F-box domain-containing protein n=1 Tax=Microthlaspi erraticum TaxID=1685480 RepID=A0A6D2HC11_9BRAS|nr:unnamed protein product [Microthlaspi erraticum]